MDTYLIHHLFLDYLRNKQDKTLTDEERRETYQTAGEWCDANGYHTDAFSYYEKSGDYDSILRKVALYNVTMTQGMSRYVLDILERAPDKVKSGHLLFPGLHIRLKLNLGQYDEDTMALARSYAEDYEARPESTVNNYALSALYANWGILRMLMSTFNDVYDFDVYWKKASDYFNKSPFEIIGAYTTLGIAAWASLVGPSRPEAHEEFIGAISRTESILSGMTINALSGYEEYALGEMCFYRGEFDEAEQYLKQSIEKAGMCDQYSTQNRALGYLMRIDFFRGDFTAATGKLSDMEKLLSEKDHGARYTMYDIACGFYWISLGLAEQIPEWLKGGFSSYAHPSFIENYANRLKAQYHYATRQYRDLLAFIEKALSQKTLLFQRIELNVLKALTLYKLKRRDEAVAALFEAYELAGPNMIEVLFIQHSIDMRTLTASALKDKVSLIPKEWLENINRKSSTYAKRMAKIISDYKMANNIEVGITLTDRETAILKDMSIGLSRAEIAAGQNISINTVKMVVNTIYEKLCVTSLPDAVRVAVERKII